MPAAAFERGRYHEMASPDLRSEALAAMATDNRSRHIGVRGDLFAFEDLRPCAPVAAGADGSLPFVALADAPILRRADSLAEYRRVADRVIWTWLPDFGGRLVAAGGSVSRIVSRQPLGSSDIDLFPVGLTQDEVRHEIRELGAHLATQCDVGEVLHVYRTRYCVSYVVAGARPRGEKQTWRRRGEATKSSLVRVTIQVILRVYSTISEVLHGFDLGSSAVADDGRRLYFTSASRLAFERGLNVLDLSRRRANFEFRAVKYLERGFALGLPELARDRFPDRLPYLELQGELEPTTATIRAVRARVRRPGGSPWSRDIRDRGGWSPAISREGNPASRLALEPRAPRPAESLYEPIKYSGAPVGFADLYHNLHNLRMGRPEALRVHVLYAAGLDICELQPLTALSAAGSLLTASLEQQEARELRKLRDLLRPETGSLRYWAALDLDDTVRTIATFRARLAKLAPRLEVPLKIETADDETIALSSIDAQVSSAIWYGAHLAPKRVQNPVPRRTAADQVAASLGLHVLASLATFVIMPYIGEMLDEACSLCWRFGLAADPGVRTAVCLNCGAELIAREPSANMLSEYVPAAANKTGREVVSDRKRRASAGSAVPAEERRRAATWGVVCRREEPAESRGWATSVDSDEDGSPRREAADNKEAVSDDEPDEPAA